MQVITPLLRYPALLAYFSGANNYTWVYFRNGKRQLLAKPLTYFEKQLPDFIRVHKTALINPAFVSSVQPPPRPKMAGIVQLQDGTLLPVSRRRWAAVLAILQAQVAVDPPLSGSTALPSSQALPEAAPPLRIQAVIEGDARLLTEQCLSQLGLNCKLQAITPVGNLPQRLMQTPESEWPVLILIDARKEKASCLLTLERLKRDPRLRVIPVIWLTATGDSSAQAYQLDANSVVAVTDDPSLFIRVLTKLFHYWLFIVQLPS